MRNAGFFAHVVRVQSRFAGTCVRCRGRWRAGDEILRVGSLRWLCLPCANAVLAECNRAVSEAAAEPAPRRDNGWRRNYRAA